MMDRVRTKYEETLKLEQITSNPKAVKPALSRRASLFRPVLLTQETCGSENTKGTEANKIHKPFIPRTFGTLLNYLAYLNKKKDLVDYISDVSIKKKNPIIL